MHDTGFVTLILAIFRLTAQDIKFGNVKVKKDAYEFLYSDWFNELCSIFDTDPKVIRKRIIKNPVSWREIYE